MLDIGQPILVLGLILIIIGIVLGLILVILGVFLGFFQVLLGYVDGRFSRHGLQAWLYHTNTCWCCRGRYGLRENVIGGR